MPVNVAKFVAGSGAVPVCALKPGNEGRALDAGDTSLTGRDGVHPRSWSRRGACAAYGAPEGAWSLAAGPGPGPPQKAARGRWEEVLCAPAAERRQWTNLMPQALQVHML